MAMVMMSCWSSLQASLPASIHRNKACAPKGQQKQDSPKEYYSEMVTIEKKQKLLYAKKKGMLKKNYYDFKMKYMQHENKLLKCYKM